MSRISKVIKDLEMIMEIHGDVYVLEWNIEDESGGMSAFKYSPDRVDRLGRKQKMNKKEFIKWVEDQKAKAPLVKKTIYNTLPMHGYPGHACNETCK